MAKNIFVYVQHLLGSGHLHRTALITTALADSGFKVTVISGGVAEAIDFGKVTFIQLPAIKTDAAFSDLFDQDGSPITADYKQTRTELLIQAFNDARPDLVLIETYPFGRRQMRFELLPLLKAIKQQEVPPIVASSIRDIIQPKSQPKRLQEVLDLLHQYFDYIFVHGDKNFIPFERTFPDTGHFQDKLIYTGYVAKPFVISAKKNTHKTILVSAGGGAVGQKLYQTAISASKQAAGQGYDWHILIGNNLSETAFTEIQAQQSANLKIERNRNDFIDLLSHCSVSVSQGGYNTMMDILVTNTQAVIIPFEGQSEQEQLIRASEFEKHQLAVLLRDKDLTTMALLSAIVDSIGSSNTDSNSAVIPQININGANWMAAFIKKHILYETGQEKFRQTSH